MPTRLCISEIKKLVLIVTIQPLTIYTSKSGHRLDVNAKFQAKPEETDWNPGDITDKIFPCNCLNC